MRRRPLAFLADENGQSPVPELRVDLDAITALLAVTHLELIPQHAGFPTGGFRIPLPHSINELGAKLFGHQPAGRQGGAFDSGVLPGTQRPGRGRFLGQRQGEDATMDGEEDIHRLWRISKNARHAI